MPRKQKTEATPKDTPKSPPKERPKNGSRRVPITEPEQAPKQRPRRTPKPAPIAAPIVGPENTEYWLYELPYFSQPGHPGYRKCHPKFFGRKLEAFFTDREAKDYLRQHELYGDFAIAERINGQIGPAWPYQNDPPEADTGEDDLIGDDLGLLNPDDIDDRDLLDPRLVRRDIKIARLESKLEAQSNGHTRNGYDPYSKIVEQVLPHIIKPPKSAVEEIREAKELMAELTPRREVNPAPAPQPAVDPKVEALKLIAGDPELRDIAKDAALEIFGVKRNNDSSPWAEVANKLLDHPQFPQVAQSAVNAAVNLVGNALSGVASMFAPRQPQAPAQQPTAPTTPIQPPQVPPAPAQPLPEAPAQPLPEAPAQQVSQSAPEASNVDPYVGMLTRVLTQLASNTPVDEAVKTVNGFLLMHPQYGDAIDDQFGMDAGTLLGAISTIPGCEQIAQLGHAKSWIEQFQTAFFGEGDESDEFTEKEIES